MTAKAIIYIDNYLDIVAAKMQTRDIAKEMGFGIADQARFSLAASELARILSWTAQDAGELIISGASKNGYQGLQVTCRVQNKHVAEVQQANILQEISVPSRSFAEACRLVDESEIEIENSEQARVTLTKWSNFN